MLEMTRIQDQNSSQPSQRAESQELQGSWDFFMW